MNRKLIIIIGAMRSGKSFWANEQIKKYNKQGQSAIVYNLGKPSDFNACIPLFIPSAEDMIKSEGKGWKDAKNISYLYDEKETPYNIESFNIDFYSKSIKLPRANDLLTERLFFDAYFKYISNTLLIFDDARNIFRNGLKSEFIQLFSRINHTGIKHKAKNFIAKGSDIYLIFHSLDLVNPELFDYATHIINFKYAMQPDFKAVENQQIREQIKKSFEALEKAPQYSYTLTDINNLKTFIHLFKN